MLLSLLIPTVTERRSQFEQLETYLRNQIDLFAVENQVELISLSDNKEMTIGEKREKLYKMASGLYSWQIDDDDNIAGDALPQVIEAIKRAPDCITFEEKCIIDGKEYRSNFSLKYSDWADDTDGFDFVRTPFFKTPILSVLCKETPIEHIRFGEDHAFARAIYPKLQREYHIDRQLYYYLHSSTDHNQRYGIK
jgi:hypothetical protein